MFCDLLGYPGAGLLVHMKLAAHLWKTKLAMTLCLAAKLDMNYDKPLTTVVELRPCCAILTT